MGLRLKIMAWLQLVLQTNTEQAQILSDILSDAGSSAVTLRDAADQPLYEPPIGETPLWNNTEVIGLFDIGVDANTNMDEVLLLITKTLGHCPHYTLNPLEDKDWVREWMTHFKPTQFGERLWIVPSHHAEQHIPQYPDAINILLDPGLAFGTGTHPTTAMCLAYLDQYPPKNLHVIDYGCGSGILAIAAAKLGASSIMAVDNDPQALLATKDNANKNLVADLFTIQLPEPVPTQQANVLVANILAKPLIDLAVHLASLIKPKGKIALSGILSEQADDVLNAYSSLFDITLFKQQNDWVCLSGTKKPDK
ncbi:Ribosomal protein L11 methyltransferase [hydrothermal vent metagenome]|uniref:Ribosomal protein L11 methyltransferase n=1 Tax=hydrothermal vent metagenome TaxID=652676 RepID=A0A3B1AKM6_9ZZZZ